MSQSNVPTALLTKCRSFPRPAPNSTKQAPAPRRASLSNVPISDAYRIQRYAVHSQHTMEAVRPYSRCAQERFERALLWWWWGVPIPPATPHQTERLFEQRQGTAGNSCWAVVLFPLFLLPLTCCSKCRSGPSLLDRCPAHLLISARTDGWS